ncbi:pyridoxamine 5'-phosphate oxidase family protein [Streptomyces violascens]|uniref:pyridoxamine 5'-phosphate oxidase family protein n=1 Tax=Streptomyces violascens TaxID=67381 RepID=UPI001CFEA638|nr:pyridoxamine 5'-phosphate oxidase family protein [Streptomyces violascens]
MTRQARARAAAEMPGAPQSPNSAAYCGCKNVTADPKVSISVDDPDEPYRYLEVRGTVERIEPDPTGAFFDVLAKRYGLEYEAPVGDAEHRVVLVVRPERTTSQ